MESKYDYVVFDIETTGLHPESDQICEIAAIGVKDGLPQGLFSTLVAIEGSMPEAAWRVNGITDEAMAWQCQDTTCSGFAPKRTDTKGDGKEEQYGAVIEKTIA